MISRASSLNPYYWPADAESPGVIVLQDEPRRFAYGHLPLYAGVLAVCVAIGNGRIPVPHAVHQRRFRWRIRVQQLGQRLERCAGGGVQMIQSNSTRLGP